MFAHSETRLIGWHTLNCLYHTITYHVS